MVLNLIITLANDLIFLDNIRSYLRKISVYYILINIEQCYVSFRIIRYGIDIIVSFWHLYYCVSTNCILYEPVNLEIVC